MTELVLLIVGVLASSGFFSCSEAALVSITEPEVDELVKNKVWGWQFLEAAKKNINRSIITIVILNNAVNIVGSILVGHVVIGLYGDASLAIATTALTFGVILFSEIIPKTLGIQSAVRIAPIVSLPVRLLTYALLPLIALLEWVTSVLHREERRIGTEDQIRFLVTKGRQDGHIEGDEGQLIHRAFILNDKQAEDAMTPLKDIISITDDLTIREAADKLILHNFSRFPVFGASVHDLKGIVLIKDVLESISIEEDHKSVSTLLRDPLVVDADMHCDELLLLFKNRHIHLAIVQEDEKTVGLITLEDVLEELVGEIEDETDND